MKRVHRREASEGHWASEGMCGDPGGKEKGIGRKKEKGKGVLEGAVMGGEGRLSNR